MSDQEELFNTEQNPGEEVGSLSDFIAKHLQNRPKPEIDGPPLPVNTSFFQSEIYQPQTHPITAYPEGSGMIIHHLDSQLVNNHLERYLPTADTRYQMIRERISNELNGIYDELNHYRQFQGKEYNQKIEALENRAALLQRKIFELDQKCSGLNPFQTALKSLQKLMPVQDPKAPARNWTIIPNPQGQIKKEVAALSFELRSIQHIMEEQLHDPSFSSHQLGRLVNQYDMNLAKAERLMAQLRSRKSLAAKLNDTLTGWIKSFSAPPK